MRLPFDLTDSKINDGARVKFSYNSPEHHQNIEISLDGEDTSVETLLDAFERFLKALGIYIPDNALLGFIEINDEDGSGDQPNNDSNDN